MQIANSESKGKRSREYNVSAEVENFLPLQSKEMIKGLLDIKTDCKHFLIVGSSEVTSLSDRTNHTVSKVYFEVNIFLMKVTYETVFVQKLRLVKVVACNALSLRSKVLT
ncbi:hypothetical protein M8J76_005267 [Diaphorina citri]|nr:hypothetical protein M8J75_012848 [Diaphorina citri]KAI5740582.1 hypothetical protein M8J76_005267 [Diaphorina citri]KAI5746212.1 hypothetical protein M8J77_001178 [Diaphorina citri]